MPMEERVKCFRPQNTSWVSGVNSVVAKSNTIEEISEFSSDIKKATKKPHNMPPYECPE